MINEFSRTELLIGEEGITKLKNSTVMVFGIGGVGSHCVEALARCGVGRLILIDNDTVSMSNINRQAVAFHSTIGQKKTEVMTKIIHDICPDTKVETYERFILQDNIEDLLALKPDYIVDAIDTVTAKIAIACGAKEKNIPIISSMGTGNKLNAQMFKIEDLSKTSVCPLCKVMRRELKARGITHLKVLYSEEKPVDTSARVSEEQNPESRKRIPGSISFVPPVAGLLIAGEVVRNLIVTKEN